MDKYGIQLHSIVPNEPCNGKALADLHFVMATQYVRRYINNMEADVVMEVDFVFARKDGEGIPRKVVELF